MAYAGRLIELINASVSRSAFLRMLAPRETPEREGGPCGSSEGKVASTGDCTIDEFEIATGAADRLDDELDTDVDPGDFADVVVDGALMTRRLDGRTSLEAGCDDVLVKVNVIKRRSSRYQTEMIMLEWTGSAREFVVCWVFS
jgi:hypothetical protein